MTVFSGVWTAPQFVSGVDEVELDTIKELFETWRVKFSRNQLRSAYRDMKVRVKPSANIPREAMDRVEAVSDWPEKAVTALAERHVFEGFVSPGAPQDPFELKALLDQNRFDLELPQAIDSTYTHSWLFTNEGVVV